MSTPQLWHGHTLAAHVSASLRAGYIAWALVSGGPATIRGAAWHAWRAGMGHRAWAAMSNNCCMATGSAPPSLLWHAGLPATACLHATAYLHARVPTGACVDLSRVLPVSFLVLPVGRPVRPRRVGGIVPAHATHGCSGSQRPGPRMLGHRAGLGLYRGGLGLYRGGLGLYRGGLDLACWSCPTGCTGLGHRGYGIVVGCTTGCWVKPSAGHVGLPVDGPLHHGVYIPALHPAPATCHTSHVTHRTHGSLNGPPRTCRNRAPYPRPHALFPWSPHPRICRNKASSDRGFINAIRGSRICRGE